MEIIQNVFLFLVWYFIISFVVDLIDYIIKKIKYSKGKYSKFMGYEYYSKSYRCWIIKEDDEFTFKSEKKLKKYITIKAREEQEGKYH